MAGDEWLSSGDGLGGEHPLYQVLSLIVATFLGTMGLPHVLVRFYTNPDGRAARRTALAVIALLSLFYLFPMLLGVFARLYVPQLLITGTADAAVLLLPGAAIGGPAGAALAALVAAGAIAAFLATSSGLLVSIAGALSTDVLRGGVRDFRLAAVVGGLVPIPLALAASSLELSRNVGLVFAVAASTLCPLLVLGIWWRGLTAAGAISGLAVGGVLSGSAAALAVTGGIDQNLLGGWPAALVGYPAAVTVPVAFVAMIASAGSPLRVHRTMWHGSSPGCMCRSDSAWASSGCRTHLQAPTSPSVKNRRDRLTDSGNRSAQACPSLPGKQAKQWVCDVSLTRVSHARRTQSTSGDPRCPTPKPRRP